MTSGIVQHLVRKDWFLNRNMVAICLALGATALIAVGFGGTGAFYTGAVLLIAVVMGLGIYLAIATVINERKDQTLPFIMSLPISAREYTTAKVLANLLIFLVPWTALIIGTFVVILGRSNVPDGLLPIAVLMFAELFASYCLILAVALVSESEGWTVVVMILCNLLFNYFLYYASHLDGIAPHMAGPTPVWNAPVGWLLAGLVATIGLLLATTFFLQGRKTDFL